MKRSKKENLFNSYVFLLGRILFASIFLIKSVEHFSPDLIAHAKSLGVPLASFSVPFSAILAFVGGLSILLGYKVKIGAWLLVIFLVPVTFMMHKFWDGANLFSSGMQHYCFWKNISMAGAALMLTHFGSGPFSLDKK